MSSLQLPHDKPAWQHWPAIAGAARLHLDVCIGSQSLEGELTPSRAARGLVIFAHGSGSSRCSPRNRMVADVLHGYHFDTLLFDLLTASEGADRNTVFDIDLLSERLAEAISWARAQEHTGHLGIGLFGASTGAAAALQAAARYPAWVSSVVCRGGRPDLALPWLHLVQAPTLLIVGGDDAGVARLNRTATRSLRGQWRLEVVPGATHLFEEAGAMETVAHLAGNWFSDHMRERVR